LCGASDVEAVGREGLHDQLTLLHCTVCGRTWSELISPESLREEEEQI
jgi:hypothetical protein